MYYTGDPFPNDFREGIDEGFDVFGLNRFGSAPGGGPGTNTSIEARGRFFGFGLFGAARGADFFGMRSCGFGFGLMRLELAASFSSFNC